MMDVENATDELMREVEQHQFAGSIKIDILREIVRRQMEVISEQHEVDLWEVSMGDDL